MHASPTASHFEIEGEMIRPERAEQALAPQGMFVADLITLRAYDKAERARFEIEH